MCRVSFHSRTLRWDQWQSRWRAETKEGREGIKDVRIDAGDERLTLGTGCCCRGRRWGEEWKLLVVWPARIQERGLPGTCRGGPSWASAIRPPNFNLRKPCLDVCCSARELFHWHYWQHFINQSVQFYVTTHCCSAVGRVYDTAALVPAARLLVFGQAACSYIGSYSCSPRVCSAENRWNR